MAERDTGLRWAGLLLPALTFLVGLALGAGLLYATTGGSDPDTGNDAQASPRAAASEGTGDTQVTLPAACDEAASKVTEAYDLLRQAADQVRDFRADQLVETLNQLEEVDSEVRPLAQECSQVSISTDPSGSASPSPTDGTTPSATPSQ